MSEGVTFLGLAQEDNRRDSLSRVPTDAAGAYEGTFSQSVATWANGARLDGTCWPSIELEATNDKEVPR